MPQKIPLGTMPTLLAWTPAGAPGQGETTFTVLVGSRVRPGGSTAQGSRRPPRRKAHGSNSNRGTVRRHSPSPCPSDPAGVDVFQIKYFPIGIAEAQRNQIRESFNRVRDNKDFKTKSWTLCLPIDMSVDEKKWFDDWAAKQKSSGIAIEPAWGATQIERLLMEPENQDIRESYFQQEHLQRLREMGGHMRQLLEEFVDRVPKPEPVVLEATLDAVKSRRCYRFDAEHVIAEVQLCFTVRNTSDNQSAQGWSVMVGVNLSPDVCMTRKTFPRIGEGPSYIRLDNTLLPLHEATTESLFGLKIKSKKILEPQLRRLLDSTIATFRAVSHNYTGPEVQVRLGDVIDWPSLLTGVEQAFLVDIKDYPGKEPE